MKEQALEVRERNTKQTDVAQNSSAFICNLKFFLYLLFYSRGKLNCLFCIMVKFMLCVKTWTFSMSGGSHSFTIVFFWKPCLCACWKGYYPESAQPVVSTLREPQSETALQSLRLLQEVDSSAHRCIQAVPCGIQWMCTAVTAWGGWGLGKEMGRRGILTYNASRQASPHQIKRKSGKMCSMMQLFSDFRWHLGRDYNFYPGEMLGLIGWKQCFTWGSS